MNDKAIKKVLYLQNLIKLNNEIIGAKKFDQKLLENLISLLNIKEKACFVLRFGLTGREPMTLEAVGQQLKITRERVRQIEVKSLKKIKGFLLTKHEREIPSVQN